MQWREYVRAVFGVERVAAWVVAALAVALVVTAVAANGGGVVSAPAASFEGSYDAANGSVTIAHAGGATVDAERLTLVVADGNQSADVTWTGADRVGQGAAVTVDDPTVDGDGDGDYFDADVTVGFALSGDATVTIRWTGRPLGAAGSQTVTLDTVELGSS